MICLMHKKENETENKYAGRVENGHSRLYGESEAEWRGKTWRIQKAAEIIAADSGAAAGPVRQSTSDISGSKEAKRRIEEWAKAKKRI